MTAVVQPDQALNVLRNRRFLALWVAQVVTQVGGNMVLYGLTVQVFSLTRSSTSVSLLILSFLVPAVIFGAVAGVYVDRLDRRLILVTTNAIRAALFLVLLLVLNDIGLILLLMVIISTLTTFFGPAEAAMIPVVVSRKQLLAANSMHIFTLQASFFLGFALLGPLVVNLAGQNALADFSCGQLPDRGAVVPAAADLQPAHKYGHSAFASAGRSGARDRRGRQRRGDDLQPARSTACASSASNRPSSGRSLTLP